MKRHINKGIRMGALTLAATTIVGFTSACGSPKKYKPLESSEIRVTMDLDKLDIKEETENYALVRMDGNIYLTKYVEEITGINVIRKYYDVRTKEFVGETLDVAWDNLVYINMKDVENIQDGETLEVQNTLQDYNQMEGKYGYGLLLPKDAIIPLKSLVKTSYPSDEQLDFFTSNSSDLQQFVDENFSYNNYYSADSIVYDFSISEDGKVCFSENDKKTSHYYLGKYTLKNERGEESIIIGRRVSKNKNDSGYNLIYDIATGKIIDLEGLKDFKKNMTIDNSTFSIKSAQKLCLNNLKSSIKVDENIKENSDEPTSEVTDLTDSDENNLEEELGNNSDEIGASSVVSDDAILEEELIDHGNDLVGVHEQEKLNSFQEKMFLANDIIVVSLQTDKDVEGLEKCYIMSHDKNHDVNDSLYYKDILGTGWGFVARNFKSLSFINMIRNVLSSSDFTFTVSSLHDYLKLNGLDEHILENYSKEDIIEIGNKLDCVTRYDAKDVYVLNSEMMEAIVADVEIDPYYFLVDNAAIPGSENLVDSGYDNKFLDVANESSFYLRGQYSTNYYGYGVDLITDGNVVPVMNINEFLISIQREDLIKDNYSWAEIQYIRVLVLERGMVLERKPNSNGR